MEHFNQGNGFYFGFIYLNDVVNWVRVKPVCIKPFQIRSHPLSWIGVLWMLSLNIFTGKN